MNMKQLRAISLFAGVGGTCLGFEQNGVVVTDAYELDKYAAETYKLNFPKTNLHVGDLAQVPNTEIPKADILIAGFPCQAFSIAGYRKGFEDERGELFFEVIRYLKYSKAQFVFLENVKNLISHDGGKTIRIIEEALTEHGFYLKKDVLNSCEYGNVPQNRERTYIVGFKDKAKAEKFTFPPKIPLTNTLDKVVNFSGEQSKEYFYTKERYPKYATMLEENVLKSDTIYQIRRIYVRENKMKVCPTLTANMGTGGHNVPIIRQYDGQIRKLTPKECFALQGFPANYKLPVNMAKSHLYKQAGNSVTVTVIKRIVERMLNAEK